MNALVGHEAKANRVLCRTFGSRAADDGGRKNGGDLSGAGGRLHLRWRSEFGVLHDGSRESKPSSMVREAVQTGWQRRANLRNEIRKNRMTV